MPEIIRALIFVLILALPVLQLGTVFLRPVVGHRELALWRNLWIAATVIVFFSPSMGSFGLALVPLALVARSKNIKGVYLYLLLMFVAPTFDRPFGIEGVIGKITDLNPPRMLALVFLLPHAVKLWRNRQEAPLQGIDKLVLLFFVMLVVLSARLEDPVQILRVSIAFLLDIVLPFFVFSRELKTPDDLKKGMAALVMACLPLAATGTFEIIRNWRLYNSVSEQWGAHLIAPYLFRDGLLRAAVTSMEPIAYGFACMVGVGCLIALQKSAGRRLLYPLVMGVLLCGLLASVSRGPWLGTGLMVIIFLILAERGMSNLARSGLGLAVVFSPLLLSPFGERFYKLLPFVGTAEKSSEDYRNMLIDISFTVIGRYPLFGSPHFLNEPEMVQLIQGQGIIDIVNSYIAIALEYGLVTLVVFLLILGVLCVSILRTCLERSSQDGDQIYRALAGMLVAVVFTIATVSSVSVIPFLCWVIAGLIIAARRVVPDGVRTLGESRMAPLRVI
jgi:hypothetical protein